LFGWQTKLRRRRCSCQCSQVPDSGGDLCSQPTISRWENALDLKTIIRLTYVMVDA
jgi:hypothetical protein